MGNHFRRNAFIKLPGLLLISAVMLHARIATAADIAIDIGHTLAKPGCISAAGLTEWSFNRKLAYAVESNLSAIGVSTHLINGDGKIDSLTKRTVLAARDRIFVSIHHDSVKQRFKPVSDQQFKGFSLWISPRNKDFRQSVGCATLIADQLLEAGFKPSHYHADSIVGEGRPVVDWDRGIFINQNLSVLATARGPAVLIEGGVIVNPAEEEWLNDPVMTAKQAQAIAKGLRQCISGRVVDVSRLSYSLPKRGAQS